VWTDKAIFQHGLDCRAVNVAISYEAVLPRKAWRHTGVAIDSNR